MSDEEVNRLIKLKGLPQVTQNTITSKVAFLEEMEKIRRQGYAIDDQENELQGRCIAAPIKDHNDTVVAALSISGPEFRMPMNKTRLLAPTLIRVCEQISEALVKTTNLH
jgi:DNA-binding IclR family transcriptional regulator